jgi:hypothetical protein
MNRLPVLVFLGVTAVNWCGAIIAVREKANSNQLGNLHLSGSFGFEPNVGQAGAGVPFVARDTDYLLTLSAGEIVLTYFEGFGDVDNWFRDETFSLKLAGSNGAARARGLDELPGKSSFRAAGAKSAPVQDIPNFERVIFADVYPGIDLLVFGNQKRLELQFLVGGGANPEQIRIAWQGARGIKVGAGGILSMRTPVGELRILPPASSESFAERQLVSGRFVRQGWSRARFQP